MPTVFCGAVAHTVKTMTRNPRPRRGQAARFLARSGVAFALSIWALLAIGCASGRAVPRPFPTPSDPSAPVPAPGGSADGYAIAGTALALQGVPYRSGGEDPSGFDCSGLVQYVLQQHDIAWPRVVHDQFEAGRRVREDEIQPGDMLFFVTEGRDVTHVGIAIGGDQFVHAPNSRGVVRVDSLASPYWRDRFVGARRAG